MWINLHISREQTQLQAALGRRGGHTATIKTITRRQVVKESLIYGCSRSHMVLLVVAPAAHSDTCTQAVPTLNQRVREGSYLHGNMRLHETSVYMGKASLPVHTQADSYPHPEPQQVHTWPTQQVHQQTTSEDPSLCERLQLGGPSPPPFKDTQIHKSTSTSSHCLVNQVARFPLYLKIHYSLHGSLPIINRRGDEV